MELDSWIPRGKAGLGVGEVPGRGLSWVWGGVRWGRADREGIGEVWRGGREGAGGVGDLVGTAEAREVREGSQVIGSLSIGFKRANYKSVLLETH